MGAAIDKLSLDGEHDVVAPTTVSKLIQEQIDIRGAMTPNERLYSIFSVDEFGHYSPEVVSTIETATTSFTAGGLVGAIIHSRISYLNWLETNKATQFTDHTAAKRSLQDAVTKGGFRGIWMWGWRTAVFCSSYQLVSTSVAVYRGKFGILEHTIGGMSAGTIYKFSLGPRGMAVGCLVGGVLGTMAGTILTGVCHLAGINMDHIRYYQQEWRKQEMTKDKQEMMDIIVQGEDYANAPLYERDSIVGKNLKLTDLDSKNTEVKPEEKK